MRPQTLVKMLEAMDALRRPERFQHILDATRCDFAGRTGFEHTPFPAPDYLLEVLTAMQSVDAADIARSMQAKAIAEDKVLDSARIGERIHQARVTAVKALLQKNTADE